MPAAAETERPARSVGVSGRGDVAGWIVFAALVAALCAWILSLPLFPSQDGAVHVYYARITRDLLLGHPGFEHDYRIARHFPPYSLHAYLLMLLLQWASPELAEKILACLCVIMGGVGLAYLARQLGRSASIAAALAVPFLLHRWIFTGFYGYSLGIGLTLVAMGIWIRPDRRKPVRRATFLLLTLLTLFAHPVPYLVSVAYGWMAVLAGWWNSRTAAPSSEVEIPAPTRGDLLTMIAASAMLLCIKLYSQSGPLWDNELLADSHDKLLRILLVFQTRDVLPLSTPIYNWTLAAVLVLVTVAVCWKARRESKTGEITRLGLVLTWAFVMLFLLPFLPRTMNGSGFFAERFSIWPPLLLFAAGASFEWSRRARPVVLAVAAGLTAFTLAMLGAYVGPIARQMDLSGTPRGELKDMRLSWRSESPAARGLTFDPFIVASVRVVDREDAVLVNGPWLDLQIMMLEETKRTSTRSGVAISRCGTSSGESTAERLAESHPERWRIRRYACFEVLEPVP